MATTLNALLGLKSGDADEETIQQLTQININHNNQQLTTTKTTTTTEKTKNNNQDPQRDPPRATRNCNGDDMKELLGYAYDNL